MHQESGPSLIWSSVSESLTRLQSRCHLGLRSRLKAPLGKVCFQTHCGGCWQDLFLNNCWTEGLSFLKVMGLRLPSAAPHMGLSSLFRQSKPMRGAKESASKTEVTVCYNLILEVMFPTFAIFCSLGASIKSSSHLKGGAPTRTGIPGGGVIASSVTSCLPHCLLLFISHCFPLRM